MNLRSLFGKGYRKSLLALCVLGLLLPFGSVLAQNDQQTFINASDPAFYYLGRHQIGETVLWTWPGSGLIVSYTNSKTVSLRIYADNFMENSSFTITRIVWYKIDRGPWQKITIGATSEADFALNVPPDPYHHIIQVVKASEGQLTFKGIVLDKGGVLAPGPVPAGRIEIVGDSISAGFKVYGGGNFEAPDDHDAKASYGWLLGQRFNAEVRLIAITRRGIVHNFGEPASQSKTLPMYYPYLQREYDIPNDWLWQPSVIIVNAGTNDLTPPGPTDPANFQQAYTDFLKMIRGYNPKAIIFALEPTGSGGGANDVYPHEIEGAVALRRAAGDSKVAYVDTKGWLSRSDLTDGIHPNVGGHIKIANQLAGLIQSAEAGQSLPGPTVVPSITATPIVSGSSCPGAKPTRLAVGQQARVISDKRGPSPIVDQPGGKVIARAPEGTVLKIFDGPRCYLRAWFWLVYLPDGRAGWVNEADHSAYYIEPFNG